MLLFQTCFPSCSIHVDLWYGKLKKYHYVLAYSELTSKATWMRPVLRHCLPDTMVHGFAES